MIGRNLKKQKSYLYYERPNHRYHVLVVD